MSVQKCDVDGEAEWNGEDDGLSLMSTKKTQPTIPRLGKKNVRQLPLKALITLLFFLAFILKRIEGFSR